MEGVGGNADVVPVKEMDGEYESETVRAADGPAWVDPIQGPADGQVGEFASLSLVDSEEDLPPVISHLDSRGSRTSLVTPSALERDALQSNGDDDDDDEAPPFLEGGIETAHHESPQQERDHQYRRENHESPQLESGHQYDHVVYESLQQEWHITVSNPEKQGGTFDGYVSYQITTTTTAPQFQREETTVRRRYRDFLWLRSEITMLCPLKIIPPIPSKDILKVNDRFSSDFIEYRRSFVETFLRRLAADPEFRETAVFVAFLEAPSFELGTLAGNHDLYSRRFELSRAGDIRFKANSTLRDADIELVNRRTRLERLVDVLRRLDAEYKDFSAREVAHSEALKVFGPCFLRLGEGEEADMSSAMSDMAGTINASASTVMARHRNVKSNFVYTIKEYILFVEAALDLLNRRDRLHYNADELGRQMEKLHAAKRQTELHGASISLGTILSSKGAGQLKQEKLYAVNLEIREVQAEVTAITDYLGTATVKVRKSLQDFEDRKQVDLQRAFEAYAEANITALQMSLADWKDMDAKVAGLE